MGLLGWALIFLTIAGIAAIFGVGGRPHGEGPVLHLPGRFRHPAGPRIGRDPHGGL
jgi:hypothetical protein